MSKAVKSKPVESNTKAQLRFVKDKLESYLRGVGKRIYVEHFYDLYQMEDNTNEEKVDILLTENKDLSRKGAELKVKFFNEISKLGKLAHIHCLQIVCLSNNLPHDLIENATYICSCLCHDRNDCIWNFEN